MKTQEQKTFQRDLLISLALHLIFVVIFIYGIPSLLTKVPEEDNTITFEILTVADIANVRNQDTKKPEVKEIKESQKIEKSAAKPKEEVKKPEEKPLKKTTEPEKEAEIIPEKKTPKKEDKPKKITPPKKEKEKTKQKKPVKKQEDPIDDIFKNLEKESEGEKKNSPNKSTSSQENEGKFARGTHNEDSPLSITEEMIIRKAIEDNWNKPAGFENIEVKFRLKLDIDGTVNDIDVEVTSGNKQLQNLLRDSAERAIRKASPIKGLSPENYDIWKNIPLNFQMQ